MKNFTSIHGDQIPRTETGEFIVNVRAYAHECGRGYTLLRLTGHGGQDAHCDLTVDELDRLTTFLHQVPVESRRVKLGRSDHAIPLRYGMVPRTGG